MDVWLVITEGVNRHLHRVASSLVGDSSPDDSPVQALLDADVSAIGGSARAGHIRLAQAVWEAMEDGGHLAVQAGTGTGKSLAYLVPALRLATGPGRPVLGFTPH